MLENSFTDPDEFAAHGFLEAKASSTAVHIVLLTAAVPQHCRPPVSVAYLPLPPMPFPRDGIQVPESFIRESMNRIDIGRGVDIPYQQEALGVILGERWAVVLMMTCV